MSKKIALVGIGKIARDQHIPSLAASAAFELAATASRHGTVEGIDAYPDLASLLAERPDIPCISLCTPPHVRYDDARRALEAGRHVMLEKPPGATLSEVHDLAALAEAKGLTLFATWHSRHAPAVSAARDWLANQTIRRLEIRWKEDVRHWHPGQDWIWEPGGLGVFDPGINALSILTAIYPHPLHLTRADLRFPENRDTPVAADLTFADGRGTDLRAAFDWLKEGSPEWDMHIDTDAGYALLSEGGARLSINGVETSAHAGPELEGEYPALYARFADLLAAGASDVDLSPMRHVADAFTLGRRTTGAAFNW
ncbi:Gfo/Idh/MocA family oxidoreductase [Psychromarinibacter sp. C21-152]|uniref:Gfo/Idh/MocA family oxidoreductase n=1 Tax=Psychromarinibacter sediminicola TaxID=3033385 RepID=A0AAE3NQQ9_9RHOB|nr:Gfo/Idh/MocA family oxidoreductase [Psychromarinibacter sediminicola]MDF0599205.1 Gfo/Idh/MocA family oxidoreductase [Psychromarinibacter sediminicola]